MESSIQFQENQYRSMIPSQNSRTSETSNSSSISNTSNNGFHQQPATANPSTPTTPKPITRSTEPNNPYPTTFVQADTASFKQVVQMLTGSTGQTKPDPPKNPIPVIKTGQKKNPSSKLYERRNSMKNFKINPLPPGFTHGSMFSPRNPITPEILSPSILNFPSLVLSPVTPLLSDPFNRSPVNEVEKTEDQAIADKEFFFHPSPANTPREVEPRLLPLFPVTSPRVAGSSN
ncbi:VQ motif-containing protein 4-like [Impatiens glandulifera]|uniref:VQ motif-containing protein 4-like n=1 Tax=Impatiens glandulifera TaxID=253017 RepID=UPI001FB0C299|nr:VQ motif-containing protein 4-like [Impatiens glandulifera]